MSVENQLLLAGDIGGTKTHLAIFSIQAGPHRPLAEATFPSRVYASLEEIVRAFLNGKELKPTSACFGVAGPIMGDRAQVTNLPWIVDAQVLGQMLGASVRLLNDLEAIAHAIPFLEPADLETINAGQPVAHGPLGIVAPGTGLGEAFLMWDGTRYHPCASEGGHADFAPTTPGELALLHYLLARGEHVSYENVCSGRGLPNLYAYLRDSGRFSEPDWLREQLAEAADLTPIIVQAALEHRAEICVETLQLFISILGSEAGNLALKVLATGGVYLAGGIPPRILPQLQTGTFMEAFMRKGRFSELLSKVPVHVIRNPAVALFGTACHGLEL